MADEAGGGNPHASIKHLLIFIGILGVIWLFNDGPSRFMAERGIEIKTDVDEFGGERISVRNSDYNNVITLSRLEGVRQPFANEYIGLQNLRGANSRVNMGNFRIENESHQSFNIPLGVNLPFVGGNNPGSQIILEPGDEAIISTGASPIGTSFRVNQCSAYMGDVNKYTPPLTKTCPSPLELARKAGFMPGNSCFDYLKKLPACTEAPKTLPENLDKECRTFITSYISYPGCVSLFQDESNFYKPEWRIFLDRKTEIWKNDTDEIWLRDGMGKVIDAWTY